MTSALRSNVENEAKLQTAESRKMMLVVNTKTQKVIKDLGQDQKEVQYCMPTILN